MGRCRYRRERIRLTAHPCALAAFALLGFVAGCAGFRPVCDRDCVSANIQQRTGFALAPAKCPDEVILPNGAALEDGLTEEEAVLIGLWNNASFQETLTDLRIARADLIQAGLLPNPEVVYFFPVSEKPFKYLIDVPIEAFWLRPIRVAAARREAGRVCERLTQSALDLIRDVRQAYADVLLAKGRLDVAQEAVRIRSRIAELAQARLEAGDISGQEAATARIDALQAQQELTRFRYDVDLAEERLRNLLALGSDGSPLSLSEVLPPLRADVDAEQLTAEATATRPDALAAEQAVTAACERLRLSRLGWVRLLGMLDATSGRDKGHEFGPAFRVTLPILNWNQGGMARAEAEWTKASRQRATIRNQIVLDVHQAHYRYNQARAELEVLDKQVRPEVETAIQRMEKAYRDGHVPYAVVLETTRQLLDSRVRQHQLHAEVRRAWAELERSVGRHLDEPALGEEEGEP